MKKERFEARLFRIFAQAGYSPVQLLTVTPEEMVEIRQTFISCLGASSLEEAGVSVAGVLGSVGSGVLVPQAAKVTTSARISSRENSLFILLTFLFVFLFY